MIEWPQWHYPDQETQFPKVTGERIEAQALDPGRALAPGLPTAATG